MTKAELDRANETTREIKEIELFISKAEKVWTGKLIKQDTKYILKSNYYGFVENSSLDLDTDLKNEILDVVRNRLNKLKEELEAI